MCLRNPVESKKAFLASQIALLLFFVLDLPLRHYPHFHPDVVDGVRGFLLSFAVGMMLLWARKNGRRSAD